MTITELKDKRALLVDIKNVLGVDSYDSDELHDLAEKMDSENDFTVDLDGAEYRFIEDAVIRETAQDEMEEMIKDCYLSTPDNKELPWWIEIDWKKTVQNCIDADGYGHHFSSYDGNEYEVTSDTYPSINYELWHIFRTN